MSANTPAIDPTPSSVTDAATMAMSPSDSTLVYAFSDRFLGTTGRIGVDAVRLDEDKVRDIAETLFGVAFGSLMRRERLSVTKVEKKKLFIKTESLLVAVAAGASAEAEPKSSLEFDIMRAASAVGKEATVRDVVVAIFGKKFEQPWSQVRQYVLAGMLRRGLAHVETVEPSGVVGRIQKKLEGPQKRYVWHVDQIDAFADRASAAWADYQSWRASQPLTADILKQIHMGILHAKASAESDDD